MLKQVKQVWQKNECSRCKIRFPLPSSTTSKISATNIKNEPLFSDGIIRDISPAGLSVYLEREEAAKISKKICTMVRLSGNGDAQEVCGVPIHDQWGQICWVDEKPNGEDKSSIGIEFAPFEYDQKKSNSQKPSLSQRSKEYLMLSKVPSFRQLIREKVKFNPTGEGESLYKYLDRILHLISNLVGSDLGMIGYVVPDDEKKEYKIITVEDTVFIGPRIDEFKKEIYASEKQKLSELSENRDYNANQSLGVCRT